MATTKSSDAFDEDLFETRLESLKDTQEGIQQMSSWCLQQRAQHKKIVACWLNVLKKVRVEHRLVLFYLANDVIQYSKRKRYEFVESWATPLQRATTMVRDEKVKGKILRIFNIWEQREIYSEEYLSDLSGLLNMNPPKKTSQPQATETSYDFQSANLISNVRECVVLSNATDVSFKKLPKAPNCDIDNIKQQLKDKSHSEDVEKEIERYITYMEAYNKNLQAEIKSRKAVLSNLDTAIKFYANQRGEVKVVVSAYKNFGSRIKLVKKKLDEISPNLPSPIPSPDINAPSPEPDADLQLPDEQSPISINLFKNSINGYSSYLDGSLPFDINDFKSDEGPNKTSSHPIEVIGSRSDDENFNTSVDFYKPGESLSAYSSGNNISIPGLSGPMPVPPVQSEYTSLARSTQQQQHQYNSILPPPTPPNLFGNNNHGRNSGGYSSMYNSDNDYHSSNTAAGNNMQPLMPPPPMPPSSLAGSGGSTQSNDGIDFNSTWDMNMSWTPLDSSIASNASSSSYTPVSPPHFERESNNSTAVPLEYSEHDNSSLVAAQDVDHRQLHLPPAFTIGAKLGLSKDKTRQLDIDHRNLISLTGSPGPGTNDTSIEKKSWLSSSSSLDQNNRTVNVTGDVDYRTGVQTIQTIDTIPMPSGSMEPSYSSSAKKSISPQKSSASSSSESQKEDIGTRYDPTDMVVDMDMSDEDLEDIFREVNEQHNDPLIDNSQASTASDEASQNVVNEHNEEQRQTPRPALLETPPEYVPQNIWEPASMSQMNMGGGGGYSSQEMGMESSPQFQQQEWNQMQMPWNGGGGRGVPPPPRPPFPMQFQYPGGGRGRGRGWAQPPAQNQYRNFQRPPRSPYFNRGGGRGSFRGNKFRGNNSWI